MSSFPFLSPYCHLFFHSGFKGQGEISKSHMIFALSIQHQGMGGRIVEEKKDILAERELSR